MESSFIGKVVDNYRILENLGIGGMGVVFKAIHIKLDKLFALKMIAPGMVMNENFITRFQREAKALARFEDPNIVRIYDLRSFNDQWFIVMEYVEGINLLDKIKKDGAFHWQQAIPILKQVLTAIGHAHRAGIIHRDIKPNNIMLTGEGVVKITDFGLAKDQASTGSTMTVTSGGTLYYMSPEHVKGFSFTDHRSDIYSVGMTFYEMITGSVPFKDMNSDFDIRETIVRKPFEKPTVLNPAIPAKLEKIVMKSIAKNPDDRYQTAEEMLQDVLDFENADIAPSAKTRERKKHLPLSTTGGTSPKPGRYPDRKMLFRAVTVIGILLVIVISFLIFYPGSFPPVRPEKKSSNLSNLSLTSSPAAVVYLDGDSIGYTPLANLSFPSGRHVVQLASTGYQTLDTLLYLAPGQALNLTFSLNRRQESGPGAESTETEPQGDLLSSVINAQVIIQSKPAGAEIWINGDYRGQTPARLDNLGPGDFQLSIQKSGYQKHSRRLTLQAGTSRQVTVSLFPLTGRLRVITAPESVMVKIDGKQIAGFTSPFSRDKIAPGKHLLEISRYGYSTHREELEIKPDVTNEITVQLNRLMGLLSIQAKPWGSIYLNRNLHLEFTDLKQEMRLPVDHYLIGVTHPTLGRWEKKVEVKSDTREEILVDFTLELPVFLAAFDERGNELSGEIYLDDQFTGRSTPAEIPIRVGLHRLTVKKEGYVSRDPEKLILVDRGSPASQKFILTKMETHSDIND